MAHFHAPFIVGASDGNRTHATSLEGWNSTIELHSQDSRFRNCPYIISHLNGFVNRFFEIFLRFFLVIFLLIFLLFSRHFAKEKRIILLKKKQTLLRGRRKCDIIFLQNQTRGEKHENSSEKRERMAT